MRRAWIQVSTVRAAAGVSIADATRYLKEWVEEKQGAGDRSRSARRSGSKSGASSHLH